MNINYNNQFTIFLPEIYAKSVSDMSPLNIKERLESGFWEKEEISILKRRIDKSDSVLELGACLGVLSIITNQLLDHSSKHTVVEANPDLINIILKNRDLNNCKFKIINAIIDTPSKNTGKFQISNFLLGSTQYSEIGHTVHVQVLPFSQFPNHNFLIVDIEGGEYSLINNNINDICNNFNKLLIEFHVQYGFSERDMQIAIKKLESGGFKKVENIGTTFYFSKS